MEEFIYSFLSGKTQSIGEVCRRELEPMVPVLLLLLLFAQSDRWFGDPVTPLASRLLTEAMPAWCLVTVAWADEAKGLR